MKTTVFLRLRDVIERTSFPRYTILRKEKEEKYPPKHKFENRTFWYEHELDEWMKDPSSFKKGGKKQ